MSNIVAAVSLLLCVGTVAFWMRSYSRHECADLSVFGTTLQAGVDSGRVVVEIIGSNPGWGDAEDQEVVRKAARAAGVHFQFRSEERRAWFPGAYGFGYADNYGLGMRWQTFTVPLWLVSGLFVVLVFACRVRRWRTRARIGRCVRCAYDIRATPGRCPECGTVPVKIPAEGSVANRLILFFIHVLGLAASAIGGWYVLSFIVAPVRSTAGVVGVISLFLAWQMVVVFFALGVLTAGYGSDDTEMLIGFLLGPILGSYGGWSVAGYGGLCFGAGAGLFVGPAVGWFRGWLVSRFSADSRRAR
jgi:hypothetical protein